MRDTVRSFLTLNLADCTEFRQALQARPPRVVHGTLLLLLALLTGAVLWAALTPADLVVRAPGRVRPITSPIKVVLPAGGPGGRVVEVCFRAGDEVREGDVLLRLDAERLDNEIAMRRRTMAAGEEELARSRQMDALLARQFEAARAKAAAELDQAQEEVRQAKERHAVDLRVARLELQNALDEEAQLRRLARSRAAADIDVVRAAGRAREARAKYDKARLPVDEGRVEILRQALILVEREFAVRREELAVKRALKAAEVEAARLELANLELERRQTVLHAPVGGVVTAGDVKVGDVLEAGKPVAEIAEQRGFLFEVTVPSEEVARLHVGMPARIKLGAFDYQKYGTLAGTVAFVAPDSGMPDGQRAVVYVVKVSVDGDEIGAGDERAKVKLGLAGQVEIVTGQESLLMLLVKKIRQTISLG